MLNIIHTQRLYKYFLLFLETQENVLNVYLIFLIVHVYSPHTTIGPTQNFVAC